ncbi:MAG: integrase [Micavibrio aeruginosavorus]|uniref:Integrase n=1 Tax=Micavibrio aeruginosavorus TaxID=349221 RepID=A0A2W5MXU5_9BACT|nr:MAG: integrase [Micavibrio aeruginosavorus]
MQDPRIKLYREMWYYVYKDGGETKRISLRTKDRGEADRSYADLVKTLALKGDTVGDIVKAYLKDKANMASHDLAALIYRKHLEPRFGNLREDQVTRSNTRDYTAFRRKAGASDWTIRRELGVLRAALGWNNKNTPAVIELPPEGKIRDRYLRKDEYQALLAAAEAPHIKLFIMLALSTAGRMSALLELTWDRVDFEHGLIKLSIGDHGNKGRATVPMNSALRPVLEEAYRARTCDYVVELGSDRILNVKKGVVAAAKRAKLKDVSPNVLRHTAAVWMAIDGVDLIKIARFLGHTNPKITYKHYAKYSPSYLADAAQSLVV